MAARGPAASLESPRTAIPSRRRHADRGVVVAALAVLGLLTGGALYLLHAGLPDLEPPTRMHAPDSGRSFAMVPGLDQSVTHPLWDLAMMAGIPQSCAVTKTWTVVETTHGRSPDTGTYMLLCPRRGLWLLTYDRKSGAVTSSGPFTSSDTVEELIDPGGKVTWDGPRPSIRLGTSR